MSENVVRKLMPADAGIVCALESQIFSDAWPEHQLCELLAQDRFVAFGIFSSAVLCGYVTAYSIDGEVEIVNVAVRERDRGAGFGTMLVQTLQQFCRDAASLRIVLEVRRGNAAARALYDKAGFQVVGTRPKYYADPIEDALIMEWLTPCPE